MVDVTYMFENERSVAGQSTHPSYARGYETSAKKYNASFLDHETTNRDFITMATPHNIDADRARVIGTSPMRNRNTNHRTIGSYYDRTSPMRNTNTNRTHLCNTTYNI